MNPTKLILGLLTPLITALAAWLTATVAKYGIHLDQNGINAALVAGATAGIAVMLKLIHDVETDVDKDLKKNLPPADAELINGVLQAVEPQLRQAAIEAVQTEVLNLAHSIQVTPQLGPSEPTPAEVTVGGEAGQSEKPGATEPAETAESPEEPEDTSAGTAESPEEPEDTPAVATESPEEPEDTPAEAADSPGSLEASPEDVPDGQPAEPEEERVTPEQPAVVAEQQALVTARSMADTASPASRRQALPPQG